MVSRKWRTSSCGVRDLDLKMKFMGASTRVERTVWRVLKLEGSAPSSAIGCKYGCQRLERRPSRLRLGAV